MAMDVAAAGRSPLDEEQLYFELLKSDDDHTISPTNTGPTGLVHAPSKSGHPTISSGYSATFSAANIKRIIHPKHAGEYPE